MYELTADNFMICVTTTISITLGSYFATLLYLQHRERSRKP